MNHRYYSVNVSNSNNDKKESISSPGVILEKEFKEIYNTLSILIFKYQNKNN